MIDSGAKAQTSQLLNQKGILQTEKPQQLIECSSSFLMAFQLVFDGFQDECPVSDLCLQDSPDVNCGSIQDEAALLLQPSPVSFDSANMVKQYYNVELIDVNAKTQETSDDYKNENLELSAQSTIFLLQDYSFKESLQKNISDKAGVKSNITGLSDLEYTLTANDLNSLKVDITGAEPNYRLNDKNSEGANFAQEVLGDVSLDTKGLKDDSLHQVNHMISQEDVSQTEVTFAKLNHLDVNSKYNETTKLVDEHKFHPVVEQVKVNVVNAIKENQGELSVQLEPRELGKMQIVLSVGKESITVNIFADKLSTYELLQKNGEQIHQQLKDSDEMDLSTNLNFGYKDFDEETRQSQKEHNDFKNQSTDYVVDIPGADLYINGLPHNNLVSVGYGSSGLLNMVV